MEDYTFIYNCNDTEELIDLFYEQLNTREPFESLPICIKIVNKIKDIKEEFNAEEEQLFIELNNLYIFLLARINEAMFALKFGCATKTEPEELNGKVFLGFCAIAKNYDEDGKNFVSTKMIKDLFNNTFPNYNINIESDLHAKFSSKDKIIKNGIYKSIIDVISDYDPYLSDYITCNIDILKTVQEEIDRMIFNYDRFEKENEKNKYKFMIEDVKEYCVNHNMDEDETLLKLAAEYHFIDKIMEYSDDYDSNDYCKIKDIVVSANRNEIDFNYITLKRLVETYLNEDVITERISKKDLDEDYISKLDTFILDYDKLSEDERLIKSIELFNLAKDNIEFDKALNYINRKLSFEGKKVLEFRKKEFK